VLGEGMPATVVVPPKGSVRFCKPFVSAGDRVRSPMTPLIPPTSHPHPLRRVGVCDAFDELVATHPFLFLCPQLRRRRAPAAKKPNLPRPA
jgi:hypothetical protein